MRVVHGALACLIALSTTASAQHAPAAAQEGKRGAAIREWLQRYDAAFTARDLAKLGTFYHPDVTVFEGGGVDRGWNAYRDRHLGPELKSFEGLKFAHSNVQIHMINESAAYVTSDYSLSATVKGRKVATGGLETLVVLRVEDGSWRIRHSHTSSRPRPAS